MSIEDAERNRETAEAARESAEYDRQHAESDEAEVGRVQAENLRVEAENVRITTDNSRLEAQDKYETELEKLRKDPGHYMTPGARRYFRRVMFGYLILATGIIFGLYGVWKQNQVSEETRVTARYVLCSADEEQKTEDRMAAWTDFNNLRKNARILKIEVTPELIKASKEARDRRLERNKPIEGGCAAFAWRPRSTGDLPPNPFEK